MKKTSTIYWAALLGIFGGSSLLMTNGFTPALTNIVKEWQIPHSVAGLCVTAFLISLAFGQIISGPVIDRFGRRNVSLICLAGATIVNVLCAINPIQNVWILIILRFILGLLVAFYSVVAYAVPGDIFTGAKLAKVNSAVVLVVCSIPAILPVVSGYLVEYASWRLIFLAFAILSGALFLITFFSMPETKLAKGQIVDKSVNISPKHMFKNYVKLCKDSKFVAFVLIAALTQGAIVSFYVGAPSLFEELFELPSFEYMLLFAGIGMLLPIGCLVNSFYATRMHTRPIIKFFLPIQTIISGFAVLTSQLENPSLPMAIILLASFVFTSAFVLPNAISFAISRKSEDAGSASSLINFIGSIVCAVVSTLFGFFEGKLSTIVISCFVLSGISTILYYKKARKQKSLISSEEQNE